MSFKNSSLMYINILTSVQHSDSILKGIPPTKRQYVLVTCTKIYISTGIASLQHIPEYKDILQMIIELGKDSYQTQPMITYQCGQRMGI